MRHIRHALRKLALTPGFTSLSILTLAIGIGATTAIFSVVNAVLLRPLPYPESDRLIVTKHNAAGVNLFGIGLSDALYFHYRDHIQAFEDLALVDNEAATLTGDTTPERLQATVATASFFRVLRTPPALGRAFTEEEEHPDAVPVVIISDGLWQRRFGSDPDILGRQVLIDGVSRQVIGVMPPDFEFQRRVDLWLPTGLDRDNASLGSFGGEGVARLADGMSPANAKADMDRLITGLEEAFPDQAAAGILLKAGFEPLAVPMREEIVGDIQATLWILLGTVGVVLMVASANVANLFVVRAEGRQRETALRTALGATRWQLTTGGLAESLLLSLAAGALGLAIAGAAIRGLIRFGPQDLPRLHEVSIDARVVAVCGGVALFTGLLFGAIPAWYARVRGLADMLKDGGRSATAGRQRHLVRHALVGGQVALALVLLIVSGLMVRSFLRLSSVDPGFRSEGILAASLFLPEADYPDDAAVAGFHQRLLERLRALPGVESAGALSVVPLDNQFSGSGYLVEDEPLEEGDLPHVFGQTYTSPQALETLGVTLKEGRGLELRDQEERSGSIVVTEALAQRFWGEESALGKRIGPRLPTEGDSDPWYTVVGVVRDVKTRGLQEDPPMMIYFPLLGKNVGDWTTRSVTLVIKSASGDPLTLVGTVRQTILGLDSNLPIARVRAMDELVSQAKAPMAFTMVMLILAGAVSMALGSVGTFGVISYLVGQRTSEIGVRMALGAQQKSILGMVMRQGLVLALGGCAVGVVLALVTTRWLESVLFEVSSLDPLTFLTVPFLLLAVALLACAYPAYRASRIMPTVALRHE